MPQESFKHIIAMDIDLANTSQDAWAKNIDVLEQELIAADLVVHGDLRWTWQGNDAVEFMTVYDPLYQSLLNQLSKLRAMAGKFNVEIKDFDDMGASLIG
jgi:hypothetical protein